MLKFGEVISKHKTLILIIAVILLIPSAYGYIKTRVNYDILSYLPKDIETMEGQDILVDEFGTGAFSMFVVEGMPDKDVAALKEKIEAVDHVEKVIWYDSIADLSVPKEILPEKLYNAFNNDDKDATMMAIIFDQTTSADSTMDAINEIRSICNKQCFLSGMSAIVTDTKALSEKETPIYVCIAVILSCIVLGLTMDSFMVPVFFLLSIGMAIVYNLGSNIFLGEISYITKALSAVLQLGVTMDYSIFLWHSYKDKQNTYSDNNEAMSHAIAETISSVVGSSITTVAGFVALCFMSFKLGLDLGIVMAKGVVFGVIGCVTILPSLILTFDRALEKTMHREIMPNFDKLATFIVNHSWIFVIVFVVLLGPAIYGQNHTSVYYDLSDTLPDDLACSQANKKLEENFDMNSIYMILADSSMSTDTANEMLDKLGDVDGVQFALGLDTALKSGIPQEFLPAKTVSELKGEDYQIMMIATDYKIASDEINNQISKVNDIVKSYDSKAMVVGEAPCTKDLITITDKDFKTVSAVSIVAIFVIILFVLKSISLPIILVSAIEFAIFVNMGIPYFTHTQIPFIASVVIGTIQLGATVDYAILMTTRYKKERSQGYAKKEAIQIALSTSIPSIIVSALGFFAATFGVGCIASVDMIGSLCTLMARGAIISMFVVIFILPSLFVLCDKLIINTSIGFKPKKNQDM